LRSGRKIISARRKRRGRAEMIIIYNISKVYSKTGWQKYEVKINDELICKFNHRAADGLAKCLAKASSAVYNKRRNGNDTRKP
jgi:hypothetical protein